MQPLLPGQAEIVFKFKPKKGREPIDQVLGGALSMAAMIQYTYHFCVVGLLFGANRQNGFGKFQEHLAYAYQGLEIDTVKLDEWRRLSTESPNHQLAHEALIKRFVHSSLSHLANVQEDIFWVRRISKQSPLTIGLIVPLELMPDIAACAMILSGLASAVKFSVQQFKTISETRQALSGRELNQALARKAEAERENVQAQTKLVEEQIRKARFDTVQAALATEAMPKSMNAGEYAQFDPMLGSMVVRDFHASIDEAKKAVETAGLEKAPVIRVLKAGLEADDYELAAVQVVVVDPTSVSRSEQ